MAVKWHAALVMAVLGTALAACGTSQAPQGSAGSTGSVAPPAQAPALPPITYEQTYTKEMAIQMADGVHIAATVTWPSLDGNSPAPGKFPVVLSVTPYSRNGLNSSPDRETYAQRGMIGVTADTRGTGGSEGNLNENYFSPLEASDSAALIEYFGTQDYSSGKVGMAGGSYVGITQLLAAEQQPAHLAAIAPQVPISDLYRDGFAHGGIPSIIFDLQYIVVQGGPGYAGTNLDPALLQVSVLGKIQQLLGTPIAFDYLERPNDDVFYRDRSPIYNANRIKVPVLLLGGWRDGLSQRGGPELYHVLSQRPGVETRLYMDPCTHKGCGAPFAPLTNPPGVENASAATFEFLAKYLLGTPTAARSPVRVYLQGADKYVDDTQWPPRATHFTRLYLDQGALNATANPVAGSQQYFTNPAAGLSMSLDQYGTVAISPYLPTDQRLETGEGLTWRSAVLDQPMRLMGPSMLHLVAASTAKDTDWIAKMSDVGPDGSETLITNGYLRASHREIDPARSREGVPFHTHMNPAPIEPGTAYPYEVEIWQTAYELAAGHRLQIRLTSYDVPTHAPASIEFHRSNPLATKVNVMLPAFNTVMEGGSDPSYLLVPVQAQ